MRSDKRTVRKPVTKFAQLRKKMHLNKIRAHVWKAKAKPKTK